MGLIGCMMHAIDWMDPGCARGISRAKAGLDCKLEIEIGHRDTNGTWT